MDVHCQAVSTMHGCTKKRCKKLHPPGYVTRCFNQLTARGCRTANCSFSHSQQDPFSPGAQWVSSGSSDRGMEKRGRKSKMDWEQEDLPAQKRARHISGGVWGGMGDYGWTSQEWRSEVWNSTGWEQPYGGFNTGYSGRNDTGYSDSGIWDTSSFEEREREINELTIKQDFLGFSYKYAKQINDAEKSHLKRRLENLIKQSKEDKFIIEDMEKNACSQSNQILVLRSELKNAPEKEKENILVSSPGASPFLEGKNFRYLTSSPLQHRASAVMETPKFNVPSILHMSHSSKFSQLLNSPTLRSHEVDSPVYIFSSPTLRSQEVDSPVYIFSSPTLRSQEVDSPVYIFSSPQLLDHGKM